MKLSPIYILIFVLNCNLFAQQKVGNDSSEGMSTKINSLAHYITGTQFNNNHKATFNSFNLIGNNTGAKVKMAIYSDLNGKPNLLLVTSASTPLNDGITSLEIPETELKPGNYWIMTLYNQDGHHIYSNANDNANPVFYAASNFENGFPIEATHFLSYTGHSFAYFLAANETKSQEISFYPNPVQDCLHIKNPNSENLSIKILNTQGIPQIQHNNNAELISIPISQLSKGNYHLIINNVATQTIVKN